MNTALQATERNPVLKQAIGDLMEYLDDAKRFTEDSLYLPERQLRSKLKQTCRAMMKAGNALEALASLLKRAEQEGAQ